MIMPIAGFSLEHYQHRFLYVSCILMVHTGKLVKGLVRFMYSNGPAHLVYLFLN